MLTYMSWSGRALGQQIPQWVEGGACENLGVRTFQKEETARAKIRLVCWGIVVRTLTGTDGQWEKSGRKCSS